MAIKPEMPKSFSKLNHLERLAWLKEKGLIDKKDSHFLLNSNEMSLQKTCEKFIENFIGCFPLPLGIIPELIMDGKTYTVPMAIEETSVIASVSKMAKWINKTGEIKTKLHGKDIIGQIQFPSVKDFSSTEKIIEEHANALIQEINQTILPSLVARGGGVNRIGLRKIERGDGKTMAVCHVYMHPIDAMGANLINQVCEFLRYPLEKLLDEKTNMCILSNLVDSKLTESEIAIDLNKLSLINDVDPEKVAEKIVEASIFAHIDPYRAATHNKGILNGIDGVLIATGNDWRAVEAGMHAYASRDGQYRGLSQWTVDKNFLIGKIISPVIVGTVGGVTKNHPTAQLSLKILDIKKADELSRLVLSVGLVQNLAAIRALTQEGIVKGHMKLHIKNLLMAAGATHDEENHIQQLAEQFLQDKKKITQTDIQMLLNQWREKSSS